MITPRMSKKDLEAKKATADTTPTDDVSGDEQLLKAQQEAAANLEGWKRAKADLENYRKRVAAEDGARRTAMTKDFLSELLPIVDNFERAFTALKPEERESSWVKGFQFIEKQVMDFLAAHNVHRFTSVGQPFDHFRHEAIDHVPGPKDQVVAETLSGYTIGEELLRPAQVKVGNGEEAPEKK